MQPEQTLQRAVVDWWSRYESGINRAAYYQRLADHHRACADEALERLNEMTEPK